MDINELALKKHKEWGGKIEIISRAEIESREDLAVAYTPGVAAASLAIRDQKERVYDYTRRGNIVAVITDGTAAVSYTHLVSADSADKFIEDTIMNGVV